MDVNETIMPELPVDQTTPIIDAPKPAGKKRGRKSNAERSAMGENIDVKPVDEKINPKKSGPTKRHRIPDENEIIQFGKQIQGLHEIAHAVTGLKSLRIGEETGKQVANSVVVICDKFGIDLFGTMGLVGALATLAVVYVPMAISARGELRARETAANSIVDIAP